MENLTCRAYVIRNARTRLFFNVLGWWRSELNNFTEGGAIPYPSVREAKKAIDNIGKHNPFKDKLEIVPASLNINTGELETIDQETAVRNIKNTVDKWSDAIKINNEKWKTVSLKDRCFGFGVFAALGGDPEVRDMFFDMGEYLSLIKA